RSHAQPLRRPATPPGSWFRAAQAIDNPLAAYLPKSATFEARPRPGKAISSTTPPLRCQLECRRADDVSADDRDVIMQLISDNMSALYAESSWGWKEREKKREIFDDRHYFLLARRTPTKSWLDWLILDLIWTSIAPCSIATNCQGQRLGKFLLLSMQIMATGRARMAKLKWSPCSKPNERHAVKFPSTTCLSTLRTAVAVNRDQFLPPVCQQDACTLTRQLKAVSTLCGPNQRKDYHIEEVCEELFYMERGDM
uniref:N-acetyltransferase domain-containing protein n=1 Tax=Macrostomum lignano TaxID=282301 RepID=A0A1I8FQY0_9PLAT